MAKKPENVKKFLEGLSEKLQPIWKKEREEMLELKKAEVEKNENLSAAWDVFNYFFCPCQCEKFGFEFSGKLDFWDFRYYMNLIEETKYAVDQEKLKEYFPIEKARGSRTTHNCVVADKE